MTQKNQRTTEQYLILELGIPAGINIDDLGHTNIQVPLIYSKSCILQKNAGYFPPINLYLVFYITYLVEPDSCSGYKYLPENLVYHFKLEKIVCTYTQLYIVCSILCFKPNHERFILAVNCGFSDHGDQVPCLGLSSAAFLSR